MAEVIKTADEFQTKVLEAKTPVLVDFFATWCGPCRMVAPVIDEIATEKAGQVTVYKVDIDQSPDLAFKYQVSSVPTLIVFENGQIKNERLGAQPKQNILAMLSFQQRQCSAESRGALTERVPQMASKAQSCRVRKIASPSIPSRTV